MVWAAYICANIKTETMKSILSFFFCLALISSSSDITERKRIEEKNIASLKEKETLLQEIHHHLRVGTAAFELQNCSFSIFWVKHRLAQGKTRKFIREGSFFSKSKLTLQKWLLIIQLWAWEFPVTDTAGLAEVQKHTATGGVKYEAAPNSMHLRGTRQDSPDRRISVSSQTKGKCVLVEHGLMSSH